VAAHQALRQPDLRAGVRLSDTSPVPADFDTYFHDRASRFSAFYRSEPVSRLLGRGPLFDRLRGTVQIVTAAGARRVLDVGCGSGPLFAPLANGGVHVVGIDPAAAMVAMARRQAEDYPDLVEVETRGWESIDDVDAYDAAVALGVFDYVDEAGDLLARMGRAAPVVVGSFPSPGVRTGLRKVRYGARGVHVHGYTRAALQSLAAGAGMRAVELRPLGRAGHLAHFARIEGV
jgi:SAM-dependent methyltransferase